MRRLARAVAAAVLVLPLTAPVALAHPLGNFTINHYAGIRVEPDRVVLDVVIDAAEIPTFQATAGLDRDGDGALSEAETAALPRARCLAIGRDLDLLVDGAAADLRLTGAGVTFPMGNGGLPTMRAACTFEAPLAMGADGVAAISFRDNFEAARIGWREVTATGDGTKVLASDDVPATTVSERLLSYPAGLAAAPDTRAVSLTVGAGGVRLAPFTVPDAAPLPPVHVGTGVVDVVGSSAIPGVRGAPGAEAPAAAEPRPVAMPAAVPGGAEAVPAILGQAPVSPLLALVALLTAALLGAGHALTPGHGKTLMAAYLVGTRGTPRHALGLGLAVSVSHTAGIVVLAVVILAAESRLPADLVVRVAPLVAAVSVVVIGSWMLVAELRRRGAAHRHAAMHAQEAAHTHEAARLGDGAGHHHEHAVHSAAHDHDYPHDHDHPHDVGDPQDRDHDRAPGHATGEIQGHPPALGGHRHGPIAHSHLPRPGTTVTWRSLFLLGLAGGLVPSASALLVLLGSIAAGRPAWGVVLVAAFGVGMAAVMTGIGLACVYARGLLGRSAGRTWLPGVGRLVPLGTAVIVLALGIVLTSQAISSARLG